MSLIEKINCSNANDVGKYKTSLGILLDSRIIFIKVPAHTFMYVKFFASTTDAN